MNVFDAIWILFSVGVVTLASIGFIKLLKVIRVRNAFADEVDAAKRNAIWDLQAQVRQKDAEMKISMINKLRELGAWLANTNPAPNRAQVMMKIDTMVREIQGKNSKFNTP